MAKNMQSTIKALSNDGLAQVRTDTDEAVERLKQRGKSNEEAKQRLDRIAELSAEVDAKTSEERRREVTNLQNVESAALRKLHAQDTHDVNAAMGGVRIILSELNSRFTSLDVFTASEQKLIDDAQAAVTKAEAAKTEAGQAWTFKESKTKAAEEVLDKAKQGVIDATAQANSLKRTRLLTESLDVTLQSFQAQVGTARQVLQDDIALIEGDIQLVRGRTVEARSIQQTAAADVGTHTRTMSDLEAQIEQKQAEQGTKVPNSEEWIAVQADITALEQNHRDTDGERNAAVAVLQTKERYLIDLGEHDKTQSKLLTNHKVFIKTLIAEAEEQIATFQSRLGAIQRAANQEAGQHLLDLSTDIQLGGVKQMVEIGAASDNARRKLVEKHEPAKRALLEAAGQGDVHSKAMAEFDATVVADMRRKYANMTAG